MGVYSVFSYQLSPQIKIPAGSTTGTITFTGVEDTLDEADETLTLTPGTPTNGTLSDACCHRVGIFETTPSLTSFFYQLFFPTTDEVCYRRCPCGLRFRLRVLSLLLIPPLVAPSHLASSPPPQHILDSQI